MHQLSWRREWEITCSLSLLSFGVCWWTVNLEAFRQCICQESLNEALLIAFAGVVVIEPKLFSLFGTVRKRSEGSTDGELLLLPAAMLGVFHCLPTHENVQFLLLFYFVLGEGRGGRPSEAIKYLWKAEIIFPLVPLKFLGRIWRAADFYLFFLIWEGGAATLSCFLVSRIANNMVARG